MTPHCWRGSTIRNSAHLAADLCPLHLAGAFVTACTVPESFSKGFMSQYYNLQSDDIRNSILRRNCLGCQHVMIIIWVDPPPIFLNCASKLFSTSIQRMRKIWTIYASPPPILISHPYIASAWGAYSAPQSPCLNKPDCFPVFLYKTLNIHHAIKLNGILQLSFFSTH